MRVRLLFLLAFAAIALPASLAAQDVSVAVDQLECIPLDGNAVVRAKIEGVQGGYTARVYFRRLNNVVEDFYWVPMRPSGGPDWWAALPKPEDHRLTAKNLEPQDGQPPPDYPWAEWWKAKEASDDRDPNDDLDDELVRERASRGKQEKRDWMEGQPNAEFQAWLDSLENEPAEYYAELFDSYGKPVPGGRSKTHVVPVRGDCPFPLSPAELGQSRNLTVGETAPWQVEESVFHWLCDGVVTRVDAAGILRADEVCRACVVAWWDKKDFLIPATIGSIIGITVITVEPQPNPSPVNPGPR